MKKVKVVVFALSVFMVSCNQSPNQKVKDAKENLTEAKDELKDAQAKEIEAAKAKETAEWKSFKNNADSSIIYMENDLKKLEARIDKAYSKDQKKLKSEYDKSKSNMEALKDKLNRRNTEFENDLKNFESKVSEKNQSFKREFKHDMDELGNSFKDLFKDNSK